MSVPVYLFIYLFIIIIIKRKSIKLA